jgi:large exoprotein involved in heme utilization and adhesion
LIENDAVISVDSLGKGEGGNIFISTENLNLNQGIISAETTSGNGGNINLTVADFLRLNNASQISTTAGNQQTGGNGGNINIFARYIFTTPEVNNDITANAFTGKGGQIFITTEAIFGIQPRDELTFLSDITASSELGVDGIIEINRLIVDPTETLSNLPETSVEVQVATGCETQKQGSVGFYNLGKTGLPAQPGDYQRSDSIITPWIPLTTELQNQSLFLEYSKYSRNSLNIGIMPSNLKINYSCHSQ